MRRNILMNPGPVIVDDRVKKSVWREDICHREPEFTTLLDNVRERLRQICGGDDSYSTIILTGSGTTALEATLTSVIKPDEKILILDNGYYGKRLFEIASIHKIPNIRLSFGWTNPIDVQRVEETLDRDETITHVAMVHHETSTGMLNYAGKIGECVARRGRQFFLDAISSVGGEDLDVRRDCIDWCVGTSNKCIESLPGISFICAPQSRFEELENISPKTFSLNIYTQYRAQEISHSPLFTPAVQTIYALECALDLLLSEGLSTRAARYRRLAERLRSGLLHLGFRFVLPPEHRSNSITAVYLPSRMTYSELHDSLRNEGFIIYASQDILRHDTFRLANMGQIGNDDIDRFLAAMERIVSKALTEKTL